MVLPMGQVPETARNWKRNRYSGEGAVLGGTDGKGTDSIGEER